ncbi:MAG TPA: LysR family transcriptional regulator [Armatimonadota bacterium]|jgi:molybdate transport repressor ModE-like protein
MSQTLNLYPLQVFRWVARHGSVTQAARELGISQPAASVHLRALEEQYGVPLFERTPRGMVLTPAGAALSEHVGRLFAEWESLGAAARAAGGEISGEVQVAASTAPAAYLLPGLLVRFRERYPNTAPSLLVGDSDQVLRWLREYRVPLGVLGEVSSALSGDEWVRHPIASDELRLVAAPGNPLVRSTAIESGQLRDQTLLLREPGSSTRAGAQLLLRGLLNGFGRVMEVTSTEVIKEAVIVDLGVAVLSSWATRREEASGLLCPILDPRLRQVRPFHLVRRADRVLVGPSRALWNCLETGG